MKKNLLTNPITLSQPAGAALAYMGIEGCVPLWHGVQGCTAFGKILFIQHFREPMPFQTTALTQTTVVMGGEANISEAMDNLSDEVKLIGVLTTGVAETCGSDVRNVVKEYQRQYPEKTIVSVGTPDFEGNLETGYVKVCKEVLSRITQSRTRVNKQQITLFVGPYFTPGEIEELRTIFEDFGLDSIILPDIGDSLNGYMTEEEYTPYSIGGTKLEDIKTLANSGLIISLGSSMENLAFEFAQEHSASSYHFDDLATLDDLDSFYKLLETYSGTTMPKKYLKQRSHLLDSLMDTQFYLSGKKAAIAGDPELITRWKNPLKDIGVSVCGITTKAFDEFPAGDLGDLENMLEENPVDFLVGCTHVAHLADDLKLPAVRTGIPVDDRIGEPQSVRLGYRGAASLYRECANALMAMAKHTIPYISSLRKTL